MSIGADLWVEPIDPADPPPTGLARQLRHRVPFTDNAAATPRELALRYLKAFRDQYGVDANEVSYLNSTIAQQDGPASAQSELRWRPDIELRKTGSVAETTVITLQQVTEVKKGGGAASPADVWAAGLRIVVQRRTTVNGTPIFCVTCSSSSIVPSPKPHPVAAAGAGAAAAAGAEFVLRPTRERRKHIGGGKKNPPRGAGETDPVVRLEEISTPLPGGNAVRRRFKSDDASIVEEQTFISHCVQCVFPWQLANTAGTCRPQPGSSNDKLRGFRYNATLQLGTTHPFKGDYVHIANLDGSEIAKPSPSLSFEPRTDSFALVNAYHHCDTAFRMLFAFGLGSPTFDGLLPIPVLHRAPILPNAPDGRVVNAQVIAVPGPGRLKPEMRFALGDGIDSVHNPLGVASDLRWVWHEFCHALLVASTGELELPFAHSAGDALAAIFGHAEADPTVSCEPPGVTFPWVEGPLRRHDRQVSEGWGWFGSLYERTSYPDLHDPFGYVAEQVLSSTLFRLYGAMGGDSPDAAVRKDSADYVAYLIMRAIASLGRAETTPCLTASVFASALMDADIGTTSFTSRAGNVRVGGALHKVIRWAFQQQGLYHLEHHPRNESGPEEPVDVYVGTADATYDYSQTSGMRRNAITLTPAVSAEGKLKVGTQYKLSAKVGSRGRDAASGTVRTVVQIFHRHGVGLRQWDQTTNWACLDTKTANIAAGAPQVVGSFSFKPTAAGNHAFLVRVFAEGDRSNLFHPLSGGGVSNPEIYSACSPTAAVDQVVPFDNNLAYGVWEAVP